MFLTCQDLQKHESTIINEALNISSKSEEN